MLRMRKERKGSRRLIARAIASILASVMLLFSGSILAQDSPRIGLKIRTLTTELRKQHNLPMDVKGALVTGVTPGSPAQEKGIVAGEVIVEAGGKPVDTAKALATSIAAASASESISLKVMNSKGERRDVTLSIPKNPTGGSAPVLPAPK
jgi:S1-C subfamily serine protease